MNAPIQPIGDRTRIAPGVYFGLSEALYHADPALGSGSVRALAKCPMYYWQDSWMNPLRPDESTTDAQRDGQALHKLVLEGREAFEKAFRCPPAMSDYPEALDTADEIKAELRALGQKVTGAKAELIERLRLADPAAVFWSDIVRAFEDECDRTGATAIKFETYAKIVASGVAISSDPRVAAAFQGGRPEISIFWEDDGVPLKARLDYTRLGTDRGRTVGLITDLKRFANQNALAPERAVISAIAGLRLDIQAALYLEGAAKFSEFIRAGQVFNADGVSTEWLAAIGELKPEDWRWYWCFHEADAPVTLLRSTRPGSDVIAAAGVDLSRALESYRENMQRFGSAWRFVDTMPDTEVSLSDLPKWIGA